MTTTTPGELTVDAEPGARTRLTEAVRGLATRASAADAERAMKFVGPSLLCVGAIVILLGWYGAANTTRVFLQIPYLISGGLFGLGLMFAGGFLYFARWITDLLNETRRQAASAEANAARTADALERIETLLRDGAVAVAAVPVAEVEPSVPVTPSAAPTVPLVATAKGTMVHRPDCRLVAGRETHAVPAGSDLGRCQICRPPIT